MIRGHCGSSVVPFLQGVSWWPLLHVGRLGGVPIEREAATLRLVAIARADTRPNDVSVVRVSERDDGPRREAGTAGGANEDVQPHRRGNDTLVTATGRREREHGRAGAAASAHVGYTSAA